MKRDEKKKMATAKDLMVMCKRGSIRDVIRSGNEKKGKEKKKVQSSIDVVDVRGFGCDCDCGDDEG